MEHISSVLARRRGRVIPPTITGANTPISSLTETDLYKMMVDQHGEWITVLDPGETPAQARARIRQSRLARLFGEAQIPPRFRDLDFNTFPVDDPDKRSALELAKAYADNPQAGSLLLLGDFGTGKTGLAIAILKARLAAHVPSLFVRVPDLLDRIRATYNRDSTVTYDEVIESVRNVPFLVLDDLGAESQTPWVIEKLYQILGHRHDYLLPTVYTTNLTLDQLEARLGERIFWRIVEDCQQVVVGGRNLREQK